MSILALIPARGGSKGIPRKNIRSMAGKPLIAWTIDAARRSSRLDRIVVSTDDEEIADVARQCGAEVPFMRPAALARDDTPGVAPVLHALTQLPDFKAVLLLQPTSPLRRTEDIDACIALAEQHQAPCAVSITESWTHPLWMYGLGPDQRLRPHAQTPFVTRRQDLPPIFALNGALYFAQTDWLQRTGAFITPDTIGYVMPQERSVDVDTLLDWRLAELLLKETP